MIPQMAGVFRVPWAGSVAATLSRVRLRGERFKNQDSRKEGSARRIGIDAHRAPLQTSHSRSAATCLVMSLMGLFLLLRLLPNNQ